MTPRPERQVVRPGIDAPIRGSTPVRRAPLSGEVGETDRVRCDLPLALPQIEASVQLTLWGAPSARHATQRTGRSHPVRGRQQGPIASAKDQQRRHRTREIGDLLDAHVSAKGRLPITELVVAAGGEVAKEVTTMWVRLTAPGLWATTREDPGGVRCRVVEDRGRSVLLLVGRPVRNFLKARGLRPNGRSVAVQIRSRVADGELTIQIVPHGGRFGL